MVSTPCASSRSTSRTGCAAPSARGSCGRSIDRWRILALGGSVGTHGRLRAPLVAFESLDDLRSSAARLDGRIAFVNHRLPPFDEAHDDPGYRQGVQARLHAASEAAKRGALAVLVRSVTAVSLRTPHTGALSYEDGVRRIPAAAVSTEDADLLARLAQRGPVEVELTLGGAHAGRCAKRQRHWRAARSRAPRRDRTARRAHRLVGRGPGGVR